MDDATSSLGSCCYHRRHAPGSRTRFPIHEGTDGMTVHRLRPLPRGKLRGEFKIAPNLISATQRALHVFYHAGRYEGGHEGICYWAGREEKGRTYLQEVVLASAHHEPFGVFVSAAAFGEVARRARRRGLGVLAQVHSHPGSDVRHSGSPPPTAANTCAPPWPSSSTSSG